MLKTRVLSGSSIVPLPWRDDLGLTQPRVVVFLLLTTWSAMLVAAGELPSFWLTMWTLGGSYLVAGGASALQHDAEPEVDRRPHLAGQQYAQQVVALGAGLSALGFMLLWWGANPLVAGLALTGAILYILLANLTLQYCLPRNLLLGAVASGLPPLIGWSAVTGSLSLLSVLLFASLFFWTTARSCALSLLNKTESTRARTAMLPFIQGETMARIQLLSYVSLTTLATFLPFAFGLLGEFYLLAAVSLGALFVGRACILLQRTDSASARQLCRYSLLYLALLFVSVVVDKIYI